MIYVDFKGKKLSALGMGTMRLPTIDGNDSQIDKQKVAEMFDYAVEKGVNYFDTAWGYHGGQSELVVGETLKRYPRESFYLASKFPGYDLNNIDKVQSIFEKQLEKCKVDYFDFYLIHNVCETNINEYLDPKYGIIEYLLKQKENGRIKHLGFSVHGSTHTTHRFLASYGQFMEFGQIQLNYLDYDFQDAKAKLELLEQFNIPVWVMEPVRGGKLAKLEDEYEAKLKALRPDESIPAWAFRYIQSLPRIGVTLSGMSNFQQLKENIEIFGESKPLNDVEMSTLLGVASDMTSKISLPCTSCKYCVTHCVKELDIPMLLGLYNEHFFSGGGFLAPMRLDSLKKDKTPDNCIGCRSCESVCPQGIKISEALSALAQAVK